MRPETWLDIHAENAPSRTALIAEGRELDFQTLSREVRSLAAGLAAEGVGKGTRVGVSLDPGLDYALLVHAALLTGAVLLPMNPRDPADQPDCDFTVAHGSDLPRISGGSIPSLERGEIPVCEIASSGTSGSRRRIPLSSANIFWSAIGSAHALGVGPGDCWTVCLPMFHVSGLMPLYRALVYGTAVSVLPGFSTSGVRRDLDSGHATGISLVPAALADLMDAAAPELQRLETVLVGGTSVPSGLVEEALAMKVKVAVTYGMTEAASQVTILAPGEVADGLGSVGRPLVTSKVDLAGGEVLVGGPSVSRACLDADGWFHTSDLGRFDDRGRLWIEGRADDVIISGGENVMPSEVEAVLREDPSVAEACVFGVPDPRWQEAVWAAVVPAPNESIDGEALIASCGSKLAPFKVPKGLCVVETIPLGPTGKPDRETLAKRCGPKPR